MTASHIYRRIYEAANYRLRTFAGGRLRRLLRPVSISLLLTRRCNARCAHCDIWKNRGPEETATAEEWKRLLSDLRSWLGPVHLLITGGEALLQPYANELVAHASGLGLAVEVLTNGYWKDQARIEQLAGANPWRVTLSVDGIGQTHSRIRGHDDFWDCTSRSIETLRRVRKRERAKYTILLKTVIMAQNLDDVVDVARFAAENELEVFYQPVERNYNTAYDRRWFEHAPTWPRDPDKAVDVVERLIALKRRGLPIANDYSQLEVMIPYFRDPASCQEAVKSHSAHERRRLCAALITLEIRPNGDVLACSYMPPVGNFRARPIRDIWRDRPRWWNDGICPAPCARNENAPIAQSPVGPPPGGIDDTAKETAKQPI